MEYRRHKVEGLCAENLGSARCNACGRRFKLENEQVFFMTGNRISLHEGFLCVKCASEYELKYLKRKF